MGVAGINFTAWGISVSELVNPMLTTISLLVGITSGVISIIKWFRNKKQS